MSARFPHDRLHRFITDVFVAQDLLPEHADVTATRLLEADLRGRSGHGIIRVPLYSERIKAGGYNTRPNIRVTHETPVSALVDGDNGMGQPIVTLANEIAIAKAKETGMAWVGTVHSNHGGAAGIYPAMAVAEGLISFYFAVANANGMPPWGGLESLLGTNPIAIGVPAGSEPPFLLDIATTVASHGTIKVVAQAGEQMPVGWVIDREGNPITDPDKAHEGFLMPIGGYKGSGLNIAIGLLAGTLNGAAFGRSVIDHRIQSNVPTNTGQAIFVMRPDLFGPADAFMERMDEQLRDFRTSESVDGGPVRLPGARAVEAEAENWAKGIPVADKLLGQLRELAAELGVEDTLA